MKFFRILIFLCIPVCGFSQTWNTINATKGNFTFDLPVAYQLYDTLNVLMYNCEVDSVYFKAHYINAQDAISEATPVGTSIDTLQFFAQNLVYLTNGDIISSQAIQSAGSNLPGHEWGLKYWVDAEVEMVSFFRVFYIKNKFYVFSITSEYAAINDALAYKVPFFDSIIVNL